MSKKTETIEIRVSPELKAALAEVGAERGRSMSDIVRGLIQAEVTGAGPAQPQETTMSITLPRAVPRFAAIALPVFAAAGLYVLAAPAPVDASAEFRIFFAELDFDRDGMVAAPEYARHLTVEDDWRPEPGCEDIPEEPCSAADVAAYTIARIDSDADGLIAYTEFEAYMLADRARSFLEIDLNENGFVTADEFAVMEVWDDYEPVPGETQNPLPAACVALLDSERYDGAAEVCGDPEGARIDIARFDEDRDGRVSLREFLEN